MVELDAITALLISLDFPTASPAIARASAVQAQSVILPEDALVSQISLKNCATNVHPDFTTIRTAYVSAAFLLITRACVGLKIGILSFL